MLGLSGTGHDEEGEVLGPDQPPEDPQRLLEENQDSEGSARYGQCGVGQAVVSGRCFIQRQMENVGKCGGGGGTSIEELYYLLKFINAM